MGSHSHSKGAGAPHARGAHGNPADIRAYADRLTDKDRDNWQEPTRVVAALGLNPGQTVCDIGVGPGYFLPYLSAAVGHTGRVFGVDVDAELLRAALATIDKKALANVTPILALPENPMLPPRSCDVVLIVNTYHHFTDGPAYLGVLAQALAPGGVLVNIDFFPEPLPIGPTPEHKVTREKFLKDAQEAGFALEAEEEFLAYQYFLKLTRHR